MNAHAFESSAAAMKSRSSESSGRVLPAPRDEDVERAVNLFILAAATWFKSAAKDGRSVVADERKSKRRPAKKRASGRGAKRAAVKSE